MSGMLYAPGALDKPPPLFPLSFAESKFWPVLWSSGRVLHYLLSCVSRAICGVSVRVYSSRDHGTLQTSFFGWQTSLPLSACYCHHSSPDPVGCQGPSLETSGSTFNETGTSGSGSPQALENGVQLMFTGSKTGLRKV